MTVITAYALCNTLNINTVHIKYKKIELWVIGLEPTYLHLPGS